MRLFFLDCLHCVVLGFSVFDSNAHESVYLTNYPDASILLHIDASILLHPT